MGPRLFSTNNMIWLFAIGYMLFYAPYSGMVKSLSGGLLLSGEAVPRFTILPIVLVATIVLMILVMTLLGLWRYLTWRRILGAPLPVLRPLCILSGVGTATIIVATTLAYTFNGVSIVVALLLMRGGVLVMAPIVDWTAGRTVHLWAWLGLTLSVAAVSIALFDQSSYVLSAAVVINLLAYLTGYVVRLEAMSRLAKTPDDATSRRFFVEEQTVSIALLLVVPLVLAIIGSNAIMLDLRAGYAGLFSADHAGPAWIIGLLYGCLFIFGSFIYLDQRENTFCIPINRCVSVIAGLIATGLLAAWFNQPGISGSQISAAFIIVIALFILAVPSIRAAYAMAGARRWLQSANILFVCDGNTSRSPMGEAMCRFQFARELGLDVKDMHALTGHIVSAGLTANDGIPLSAASAAALEDLDIPVFDHGSRSINAQMIDAADYVFCMTEAQRLTLVERFPDASGKLLRLDADRDIANPAGGNAANYLDVARHIASAVERRVEELLNTRMPAFTG